MIIGTAGHIDHGKSALIKAITGRDPSRLKEEKRRGITIDLGFAYWPQPDGSSIGFVDVPGHEKFIRTMLAGASGIDCALICVAADEGIKPQTLEHLEIIRLLGIQKAVVALTKSDKADSTRLAETSAAAAKLLAGTALAGARLIPVSSVTGAGIGALKETLAALAADFRSRSSGGLFRFSIDRSFSLPGAGTIVTGTVISGCARIDDRLVISPGGIDARLRGIRAHDRETGEARAGQRCALNLAGPGVSAEAFSRGDMAVDPALALPAVRLDAIAALALPSNIKPRQWLPARLYCNAAERGGRLIFLGEDSGGERLIQIIPDEPLPAAHGDRFILRDTSAQITLGGGRFLDVAPPLRRRGAAQRLDALRAMAEGAPEAIAARLLRLPPHHLIVEVFARNFALPLTSAAEIFSGQSAIAFPAPDGTAVMSAAEWLTVRRNTAAALAAHHAKNPDQPGAPLAALRLAVQPLLPPLVFRAALGHLQKLGDLALEGGWARLASHQQTFSREDEALWSRVEPLFGAAPAFRPPRGREIAQALRLDHGKLIAMLKRRARQGALFEIEPDHFFPRGTLAEISREASAAAETKSGGLFTAGDLRDRLSIGRRTAILLLEFFDRHGITIRRGDLRRVDSRKAQLFNSAD